MRILFCFVALLMSSMAFAVEDNYEFDTAQQAALFDELTKELRCPKCQNQNIADSDAVVAKDLRDKVHQLVNEGQSKDQVIDYMIDRYGYFVHYEPPVTAATIVLWVLPLAIIVLGFGFVIVRQKKSARKATWNDADEQRLAQLIEQYENKDGNS